MADQEWRERALHEAQRRGVRFVRLWFTDVLGQLKSFAINANDLPAAFEHGVSFDGSSITGYSATEEAEMVALPDPSTFAVLPWRPEEQAVARVFCDVLTPEGRPYEGDPRYILRRAVDRAQSLGFTVEVGPELEYYLLRSVQNPEPLDAGGYFDLTTLDAGSDVRRETVLALERLGVEVAATHHEGGPSQHEIDLRSGEVLAIADNCMTARITIKEYALKYGWHATFMPKPRAGDNGSGMHTNLVLLKEGENALFDGSDRYQLSPAAKGFIAGQLHHARELCLVFAQWVNSYKRLVPGYEAPLYAAWSRRNRSALVRVPVRERSRSEVGIELRGPDPACNPYLAFAVIIHAGLEGIERGYPLPEPMEENLYDLSPQERRKLGIDRLPGSLGEAVEVASDSELLLRALGEHALERLLALKRQEWEEFRAQVTDWELARYLPVI